MASGDREAALRIRRTRHDLPQSPATSSARLDHRTARAPLRRTSRLAMWKGPNEYGQRSACYSTRGDAFRRGSSTATHGQGLNEAEAPLLADLNRWSRCSRRGSPHRGNRPAVDWERFTSDQMWRTSSGNGKSCSHVAPCPVTNFHAALSQCASIDPGMAEQSTWSPHHTCSETSAPT